MIIQVSSESPEVVRAIAALVLSAHIASGGVGLITGGVALLAPKSGGLHRWSGVTFVLAMLLMSGIGAAAAPFLPQRSSVTPGLLTFYLVATGWMSVKRQGPPIDLLNIMVLVFALFAVTLGLTWGVMAADSAAGLDGDGPPTFYSFAGMTAVAAALDIKVMFGRALLGRQRLRRHLWRMGAALLIAAVSFFLGQQKVLPAALRGSPILFLPEFVILAMTAFWFWRLGRGRPAQPQASTSQLSMAK
jgi:hypothetical protein